MFQQLLQDEKFNNSSCVNVTMLDSIFQGMLTRDYKYKITNVNKEGTILGTSGNDDGYLNYALGDKPIGISGYQTIKTEISIPYSYYMKISLVTSIISLLVLLAIFIGLLYLLITLQKKYHDLKSRENSISGVLHDIKTPISNVVYILDALGLHESDESTRNIIARNKSSIMFLQNKIESLLVISSNKKRKLLPNYRLQNSDDIEEVVSNITFVLNQKYKSKKPNISIVNNINKDISLDPLYFESILVNLIENSLKYSNNEVAVGVDINIEDNDKLVINVKDNGFGIERKEYKNVFEQYYRIDERHEKGSGIGLNYSRMLAKIHGGDLILVSSELGKGSWFQATLKIR